MRVNKTTIGVSLAAAVFIIGGGIAIAAWNVSGSGSGTGAASDVSSLTLIPETPSGANASIYPGGPAGPVFFNIVNPNPFAVTITGITWGAATSTNTSSCASSNISVDAAAPTTVSISVPAASTDPNVQVNGVLDLAHTAGSGCQGVAFDVVATVTGAQQ